MEQFKYKYDDLFNPTLNAIRKLGGSASVSEIEEEVSRALDLTDDEANDIHRGSTTKLYYRLAWAKNYLKRYGLLENSARGIWSLTSEGQKIDSVNKEKVKGAVAEMEQKQKVEKVDTAEEQSNNELQKLEWQERLLSILQEIPPDKFERLCQRVLRELGFVDVDITGRSGDGGIDGKGVIRIGGVLSFHVVFQCKRYKGTVSSSLIRDFRGAMVGRAEKGLFITTGNFSREAKKEAQRDGAPPIDLIDGLQFVENIKDLQLGVKIYQVEKVEIMKEWFDNF